MAVAIPALALMLLAGDLWLILAMVFIIGFAIANVFPIIFSAALKRQPDYANEISGLLITGVAGGAVIPLLMGLVSDAIGQTGGMAVLLLTMAYLMFCALKMKGEK